MAELLNTNLENLTKDKEFPAQKQLLESIDYELPLMIKESVLFSDFIHMVQLQDIIGQQFNQITFIGNYSKILKEQQNNIYSINKSMKANVTSLFLNKKTDYNKFRPNHSSIYFDYEVVDDFNHLFDGMIKCNDFYILINTENEDIKYGVYSIAKEKSLHALGVEYCCFVFIGKIINPTPYTKNEIELFEKFNTLSLSSKLKEYLLNHPKIYYLNLTKKLYFINLFGSFPKLSIKFDKNENNFNLEHFRPLLNEMFEKQIIEPDYDFSKDESYGNLMKDLEQETNNFYNGFIKIGTIVDETHKNLNVRVEIFLLLNSDETTQGTIWINENMPDPTDKTEDFINYLPFKDMKKVASLLD
jgi:hypothetical protein